MQTLIDMLGNFLEQPNGKVVVFTSFARVLTVMQALMTRPPPRLDTDEIYNLRLIAGTCLYYHGELTDEQGNEVLRKFKDNPRYRVLFTTDAGGQGINLQECASFIIHYDAPLSMGQLEQREGRVYRRGQKLPVLIQSLTYAPQEEMQQALGSFSTKLSAGNARFVDPKLVAMLRNKATEVKAFMDGL
jgi:SNF2 family DNA or RNA helicase